MDKRYSFVVVSKGDQTVYTIGRPIRDRAAYVKALEDPMRYCYDGATVVAESADADEINRLRAKCEEEGITGGNIEFQSRYSDERKPVPARIEALRRALLAILGGEYNRYYGIVADGCDVYSAGVEGEGWWSTAYAVRVTAEAEERIRARVAAMPAAQREWVQSNTSWMTTMDADGPNHRQNARYLLIDANAA